MSEIKQKKISWHNLFLMYCNTLDKTIIKFKMVDFSLFLFAQIDKIFENFVRLDEYPQHR